MRRRLLAVVVCPACRHGLVVEREKGRGEEADAEVAAGVLRCRGCGREYPVIDVVPGLAPSLLGASHDDRFVAKRRTASFYGYGWRRSKSNQGVAVGFRSHFDMMAETVPVELVRGPLVLDGGCGGGRDVAVMAEKYPQTEFIGVDLSEGVYVARERTRTLPNVQIVRGDLTGLPFRDETFASVYSYGVLHHTPNPQASLGELVRVARREAPVVTYLYEDFSESRVRYWLARARAGAGENT